MAHHWLTNGSPECLAGRSALAGGRDPSIVERWSTSRESMPRPQRPTVLAERHRIVGSARGESRRSTGNGNGSAAPTRTPYAEKSAKQLRKRYRREKELEAYQVELLKLQRHLEATGLKMIVVFEGRDAAGKGGTIRRVTRYMNEKHYRVVALGKPTDEQRGPVVPPEVRHAVPARGRDGAVRSQLVQPGDGRAGLRLLHREGAPGLPPGRRRLREGPRPTGNRPGQAVLLGDQEGAAASLRPSARRSAPAVEAQRGRRPGAGPVGRVHRAQVRDAAAAPTPPQPRGPSSDRRTSTGRASTRSR